MGRLLTATTTATTRCGCRTASATTGAPAPTTPAATGAPTATTATLATVVSPTLRPTYCTTRITQPSCRLRRLLCRGAQLRGRVRRGQYNFSGHHHARQQLWHAWALDPRGGRVDDPVSCPGKAGERHLTSQRVQPARQRHEAVGGAGAEPLQRVARRGHGGAARPRHRRHRLCRCAMEASAPSPPSLAPPTSNYTSTAPLPVAPWTFRRSSPRVARMHPHLCKPRGPAQSTMPSLRPPRHHRRLCCLRASLSSVSSATKTRTTGHSTR